MKCLLGVLLACSIATAIEPGFKPLFDGETLDGWTVLARESQDGGWKVDRDTLAVEGRPGNIATVADYADFDLRLEWKIPALGNSGVFYRFAGTGNPAAEAIEYQLADNARPASQKFDNRKVGAAYGLYPPLQDRSRAPGEWNTLRIVALGTRVRHWLNGHKVVEFDFGSEEFAKRAEAAGKASGFGLARSGKIVLQDHASLVWFRNLRIRRLD